ncbi:hypothetical protein D3C81_1717690 [compost metagenome]
MAVQAQVTITMVENDQKSSTAQPVGEYHAPAVHGAYLGAGVGADHHAVPLGPGIAASGFTETCQQSTIDGPGKFAPSGRKSTTVG